MSIISKEIAKQHLEMWLKAEEAVSTGQSYQIEQMQLTRASLKQIRESIPFGRARWQKPSGRNRGGAGTVSTISPRMMCKDGGKHGKFSG